MAPTIAQAAGHLREVVYYHLDNGLEDNALFVAGRMHAIEPRNAEGIYLLALCHFRLKEYKSVYDCSRLLGLRGVHVGCSYIFAQACLALEKNIDGITALERARTVWEGKAHGKHFDQSRRFHPDTAAIYTLLGKLTHGNGDIKRAVEYYCAALKLNPFMWDAFEQLCNTGTNIRPSNIFRLHPEVIRILSIRSRHNVLEEEEKGSGQALPEPSDHTRTSRLEPPPLQELHTSIPDINAVASGANDAVMPQNITASSQNDIGRANNSRPCNSVPSEYLNAPLRKSRTVQSTSNDRSTEPVKLRSVTDKRSNDTFGPQESEETNRGGNSIPNQHKRTFSGTIPQPTSRADLSMAPAPRRSGRLLKPPSGKINAAPLDLTSRDGRELKKAKATNTRNRTPATISTVGRIVSGNRKPLEASQLPPKDLRTTSSSNESHSSNHKPLNKEIDRDDEVFQHIIELFGKIGHGYYALNRFQGQLALQHFYSLSAQHRETPWVLAQIGKAQFELSNYAEAGKTFGRIKKMAPSRIKEMDLYSTILYHLKSDAELAFLSHELVDAHRLSPQAWCSLGNSFSLQRDHDRALKCFKRATQLSPKFAYAYTLQGHEHMENEEYDKAQSAYRRAISSDHRHYNGWYGLGKVYEKLGKFEMAERHYRFAASINPTNAILACCIGVVLEKMKKNQAALVQYEHACELAPQSAISRFKKARALLHLGRAPEALEEFKVLKDMVPDESNVHFMLGKVYKNLRDKASAIRHFTIALNLDPKAAQYIKEAMETLDEQDFMHEGDDDDGQMS